MLQVRCVVNPLPPGIHEEEKLPLSGALTYITQLLKFLKAIETKLADTSNANNVENRQMTLSVSTSTSGGGGDAMSGRDQTNSSNLSNLPNQFDSDCYLIVLEKNIMGGGTSKDKNKKDSENAKKYMNKIGKFKQDVLGINTVSSNKLQVIVCDVIFIKLREFNSFLYKLSCDGDIGSSSNTSSNIPNSVIGTSGASQLNENEFLAFVNNNPTFKKTFKAIITELSYKRTEDTFTHFQHVLLYSSIDDKYDLLTFTPFAMNKCLKSLSSENTTSTSSSNKHVASNSTERHSNTTGGNKSKSNKR